MVFAWLIKIALVAFFVWLAWTALQPRYAVRIVVDRRGVQLLAGVPAARRQTVAEFLEKDIDIEDRITVLGTRGRDGKMHYQFRGRLHPSTQQRIRNFLAMNL